MQIYVSYKEKRCSSSGKPKMIPAPPYQKLSIQEQQHINPLLHTKLCAGLSFCIQFVSVTLSLGSQHYYRFTYRRVINIIKMMQQIIQLMEKEKPKSKNNQTENIIKNESNGFFFPSREGKTQILMYS